MKRNPLFYIILVVLLCVFGFSAWQVGSYLLESFQQKEKYDHLAELVEQAQSAVKPTAAENEPVPEGTETVESAPTEETEPAVLPEYEALVEMNPDLVGWIKIEDTNINYPVMQTPNQPEYYLYRDFYGDDSDRGCIFAEEDCDISTPSDNVILYGHCMRDGSMFANLDKYLKKSFWEEHDTVQFDSLTEHRTYQIFAVFKTSAYVGEGFAYHTFINAVNAAEFNSFVSKCKELSFYDTGITPEYGDKLLCLSTCEYTQANGRLVVVAVLTD